ncbi:MAG: leucine--tRNA ligase [Oscillospiraceae bacterium]|nr:leucine--tRNA ligase [Oscillospiraceae bacterium]
MEYNVKEIEARWQKKWVEENTFAASEDHSKPKYYALVEFPYPSGDGLHVGHPRTYTGMDIIARKRRMQGYNVLFPMGFDAFGLPAENYAIKNHVHPATVTQRNIKRFTKQMQSLGFSFDWTRVVDTTDPKYYKWTQWIFLQLFKKGLAYKKEMAVNFCTGCKVVLANEEVVNGVCERCHSPVIRKMQSQWMLKITEYADRLDKEIDLVDYMNKISISQRNWIGKSHGAEVIFGTTAGDEMRVYTTRPDTLFGVTYMVMAPEHAFIQKWTDQITNMDEIKAYQDEAARKSDFERTELAKDKTGVRIQGVEAINPVNGTKIPIFISDYVLASYGTGAIMAVPGHDTRDYEFAKVFDLPIIEVVGGGDITKEAFTDCETGVMVNSGFLTGLSVEEAKVKITEWLAENGKGEPKVNFKLRDWVFSRQRYWGEPIPMVYCEKCGWQPIPEEELPLMLPEVKNYEQTDDGQSPLAKMDEWVNTTCPCCGGPAKRETDTMPQWAGSSWYFVRYTDPHNDEEIASKDEMNYWLPVDWYNGGMEHTTLHLLYSRFWYKFLYDIGVVPNPEPYQKRTSHGMILGEDGEKMSKSRGNVVNPDDVIDEYGSDSMRLYEMFVGDFEKVALWQTSSIKGCRRFLERIWGLMDIMTDSEEYSKDLESEMHRTIKKVSSDIEHLGFNTAIAAMMGLVNKFYSKGSITKGELRTFLKLVNPFAPHISEEMQQVLGFGEELAYSKWPEYDEAKCVDQTIEIAVQINGKVRSRMTVEIDADKDQVLADAKADEKIAEFLTGKQIVKEIYIPGKIVNIVAK